VPRLRDLRRAAGLTQTELARRAGISRVTLARIETGAQVALAPTAHRLCTALGIAYPDVEEFRGADQPPTP
jgi:transcriptional regulator with XRE-family HTH domain